MYSNNSFYKFKTRIEKIKETFKTPSQKIQNKNPWRLEIQFRNDKCEDQCKTVVMYRGKKLLKTVLRWFHEDPFPIDCTICSFHQVQFVSGLLFYLHLLIAIYKYGCKEPFLWHTELWRKGLISMCINCIL